MGHVKFVYDPIGVQNCKGTSLLFLEKYYKKQKYNTHMKKNNEIGEIIRVWSKNELKIQKMNYQRIKKELWLEKNTELETNYKCIKKKL